MNNFNLAGKLCEDAQISKTSSGTTMSRIKVAVEKTNRDQQTSDDIYEVVLFRSLAELDLKAGDNVAISGKLQANNYLKDDVSYYNCNLIASSVIQM